MAAPTSLQEEDAVGGRGGQGMVKAGIKPALGAPLSVAEDILELMPRK